MFGADAAYVLANGLLLDCVKIGADERKLLCGPTCGPTGQPFALLNKLFKVSFAFWLIGVLIFASWLIGIELIFAF